MVSPNTDDHFIIPLRAAEATRDFLQELARVPVTMSIKDDFVSMWYPYMKAAVDAGHDLKSLCDKIRTRSKYTFAMRDLEELYLKAKADEDEGNLQIGRAKRPALKRASVEISTDAAKVGAASVTTINTKAARAAVTPNTNATGFDPENDPNDAEVLRNV